MNRYWAVAINAASAAAAAAVTSLSATPNVPGWVLALVLTFNAALHAIPDTVVKPATPVPAVKP